MNENSEITISLSCRELRFIKAALHGYKTKFNDFKLENEIVSIINKITNYHDQTVAKINLENRRHKLTTKKALNGQLSDQEESQLRRIKEDLNSLNV